MKKLFTIVAMGAAVLTASAQKTVQGSRFFDNWSVGIVGGGIVPATNSDYIKDIRATYGVEINKQITPAHSSQLLTMLLPARISSTLPT